MIVRSTDIRGALRARQARGFFTLPGGVGIGIPGGSTPGLLDTYSGAVAGYSVGRGLRAAQVYMCRVRKASDGYASTYDVQFAGLLPDTSGLTTFTGASSAVVESLYDQSGNGYDLGYPGGGFSADLAQLVASGTPNTDGTNSRLALVLSHASGALTSAVTAPSFGTTTGLSGNAAYSVFAVYRKTTTAQGSVYGWGNTAVALNATGHLDDNSIRGLFFAGGHAYPTTAPTNNTHYLLTYIKTAGAINTTSAAYRNGSSVATGAPSSSTPTVAGGYPLAIGRWANYTSNTLFGKLQELIIFAGDKSSDRAAIEANINAYYGIY
jgi:hypothetical protein